jgi:hypothetical protein
MTGAKMQLQKQHPLEITLLDLKQLESNIGWMDGLESWKLFHEDLLYKIKICAECLKNHKERKK